MNNKSPLKKKDFCDTINIGFYDLYDTFSRRDV